MKKKLLVFVNKIMNKLFKNLIKYILNFLLSNNYSIKILSILKEIQSYQRVKYKKKFFFFLNLNWITQFRIKTFYSKEPETLNWISSFKKNQIFWDIGANIGLYSIFASYYNVLTYAFEPSVFNLEILVKNIIKNKLQNKIKVIVNPISKKSEISNFNYSSEESGAALSSFKLKNKKIINFYKMNSISVRDLKKNYNIKKPDHVKIDVDGNEFEILDSLLHEYKSIKSFLIEVNKDKNKIHKLLFKNNYKLAFKQKNKLNEIWYKHPTGKRVKKFL